LKMSKKLTRNFRKILSPLTVLLITPLLGWGCATTPVGVPKFSRPNEPKIVTELKAIIAEQDRLYHEEMLRIFDPQQEKAKYVTDEQREAYLEALRLEPSETLEILGWGMRLEKSPCWK
jgi:hypothetical protein